jgi:hypothetical protein
MAEERIDSYVDRTGFAGDTKFAIDQINSLLESLNKANGVKIRFGGVDGFQGFDAAAKQASAEMTNLDNITKKVSARVAELNGHSKELTQQILIEAKAEKELAKARLDDAKAAQLASKSKKDATKSGNDAAAAKARESKLIDEAINDYLQLSKAYNEAALKAKNYVLRLGEGHPIAQQAVKDANDLGNVLKKLDASVGQNQRNVGNYSSAFNGLGFSFTQVARELPSLAVNFQQFALAISNNLPMVADQIGQTKREIAALRAEGKNAPSLFSQISKSIFSLQVALSVGITLFTVFSKRIGEFVVGLFRGGEASQRAAALQKQLSDVYSEAAEAVGENVAALSSYRAKLNDTSLSETERVKVLKSYNETADKTNKIDTTQINNLDLINEKLDAQNKLILKRAVSLAATAKLGEAASTFVDSQLQFDLLVKNSGKTKAEIEKQAAVLAKTMSGIKGASREAQDAAGAAFRSFAASTGIPLKKANEILNAINAVNKAGKELKEAENLLSPLIISDEVKTKSKKSAKDLAEQRRQALFEIQKVQIEAEIEGAKIIIENEKASYLERFNALQAYTVAKNNLIELEADFEKGKKGITREEVLAIEAQKWKAELDLARESVQLLDKIEFSDRTGPLREALKKRLDEIRKSLKEEIKLREDLQKSIEKSAEDHIKRLQEKYDADIKKRQDDYKAFVEERKRLERELTQELISLGNELLNAALEREKNQVQDRIDALEAQKQKDIETVNQTVTNRQQAADQIAIIEARAAAERNRLEKEQRRIQQEQARFDKAASIASIIAKTAEAIIGFLAKPGGVQGVTLSVLAGAIGAAQLAKVITTPIPRYFMGKGEYDKYEGPAWVDDGGKPEAIVRESGEIEIGGNKPRITWVGRNDIVIPDARRVTDRVITRQLEKQSKITVSPVPVFQTTTLEKKLDSQTALLRRISNKPDLSLQTSEQGLTALWNWGANQTNYLNENTNW